MSEHAHKFDEILEEWAFESGQVQVRQIEGEDGRDLIQMRVDMGLLQMEVTGRPDGQAPEGFETYFDYLVAQAFEEGDSFRLDDDQCTEVDREFYQFYHRRICWLTLREYAAAIKDASHTIAMMDFTSAYAPDPEWSLVHEQYRPFVMFHRIQATALMHLEDNDPESAVKAIDEGLKELMQVFEKHEAGEYFEEDSFVQKLQEMRVAIVDQYELGPTLAEQLAKAIESEQYELAAKLRDRMTRPGGSA